jgi:two-component system phosphate regulon sensor histidine kinase PhoR
LASIKAYAETLRLGALEDPEYRGKFVERIEEQAERLHALITDLLLLARVEAGQETLQFTDVSLSAMADECVARFRELAESKSIDLDWNRDAPNLLVHVDQEGLRTILNNLIDNAVKYTPERGQVVVSWRLEDGYAVLEVRDTGIGIAARDQARVFERFYRAEKARSRELGGTGLGLAIVKHLAQSLGGDVGLESREGIGSTFRVRLPTTSRDHARSP